MLNCLDTSATHSLTVSKPADPNEDDPSNKNMRSKSELDAVGQTNHNMYIFL